MLPEPKSWDHFAKARTKTMQAEAEEFRETCPDYLQPPRPHLVPHCSSVSCPVSSLAEPSQKPTWTVESWGGVGEEWPSYGKRGARKGWRMDP